MIIRESKSEVRKEIFKLLLFITNTNNVLHVSMKVEIGKKIINQFVVRNFSLVSLRCTWHAAQYTAKCTA